MLLVYNTTAVADEINPRECLQREVYVMAERIYSSEEKYMSTEGGICNGRANIQFGGKIYTHCVCIFFLQQNNHRIHAFT